MAVITSDNPHMQRRLAKIERGMDPKLKAILIEQVATHNRLLSYALSAAVVFAVAFYAATKV